MASPVLVWFRDDHRLSDNPALAAAIDTGSQVLCLVVIGEACGNLRPLGGAARWWLHGSLKALGESLERAGSRLFLLKGPALETLEQVALETKTSAVFWNRRYGAAEIALDSAVKKRLTDLGVKAQSFKSRLLHEPWDITNQAGKPFQVFTPYARAVMRRPIEPPIPAPSRIPGGPWPQVLSKASLPLDSFGFEPSNPDWAADFRSVWQPGEKAAQDRLALFLDDNLRGYAQNRDVPALEATSRLSPHLRFGEISPRQVWHAVTGMTARQPGLETGAEKFLTEVIWRDFSHQLLHMHPHLPKKPHSSRFESFPWAEDQKALIAWQKGRTGYPIVDAGMRQLWRTGWMHNRVRMIAASFLVKHLLTDWQQGEAWFWDTLVDADPANNAFSWQWIAGSGPDSAPFHRIFNP